VSSGFHGATALPNVADHCLLVVIATSWRFTLPFPFR
jgi:hypothetical protein